MSLKALNRLVEEVLTEGYTAPADFLTSSDADIAAAEKKFGETCKQEWNPSSKSFRTYNPKGGEIILDWEAFHKAYDKALNKLGVLNLFKDGIPEEAELNRCRWDQIKDLVSTDKYEKRAISALKMVWGIIAHNIPHTSTKWEKYREQERERYHITNEVLPKLIGQVKKELAAKEEQKLTAYLEEICKDVMSNQSDAFAEFTNELHNLYNENAGLYVKDCSLDDNRDITCPFKVDLNYTELLNKFGKDVTVDDIRPFVHWRLSQNDTYLGTLTTRLHSARFKVTLAFGMNNSDDHDKYGRLCYMTFTLYLKNCNSVEATKRSLAKKTPAPIWLWTKSEYDKQLSSLKDLKMRYDATQAEKAKIEKHRLAVKDLRAVEWLDKFSGGNYHVRIAYVAGDFSDAFDVYKSEARSMVTGKLLEKIPEVSIPFAIVVSNYEVENEHNILLYRATSTTWYSWNSKLTDMLGLLEPEGHKSNFFLTTTSFKRLQSGRGWDELCTDYDFDSWAIDSSTTYAD